MKKAIKGLFALALLMFFIACASSPKHAMEKYGEDLCKGRYAAFVDGIEVNSPMSTTDKQEFVALIESKMVPDYAKRGGLKEFKVLSEEIAPGDTTALVYYEMIFGDGTVDDGTQQMIKRNGRWKMSLIK